MFDSESSNSEAEESFLNALGRMVIWWAHFENRLDICLDVVYDLLDGKLLESKKPESLKSKLKFIRRAANKLECLSAYNDELTSLVVRAQNIKQSRHNLIHGYVVENGSYCEVKGQKFKMERRLPQKTIADTDKYEVSEKDVLILVIKSADLAMEFDDVTHRICRDVLNI